MASLHTEATFKMNVAQLMKWQQQHPEAAAALFAASVANQPELQQAQGMRGGWDRVKHEVKMAFNWEGYRQRLEASIFTDQLAQTFPAKETEGPKSQAVAPTSGQSLSPQVATAHELRRSGPARDIDAIEMEMIETAEHAAKFIRQEQSQYYKEIRVANVPATWALESALTDAENAAKRDARSIPERISELKSMEANLEKASKALGREITIPPRISAELTRRVEQRVELSERVKAQIEQAGRWEKAIVEWVKNPQHEAAFQQLDKALSGAMTAQRPNLSDVNRQQTMKEMSHNLKDAAAILKKPLELGGNVGTKVKQEFAKKWPEKKLSQQVGVGI